ncbi:hypothetical protein NL108_016188 [Boleophthalmus pectinirostris]|nr:hypothetical protein NL108_016188 [Boleophthalmus pectinirostris]
MMTTSSGLRGKKLKDQEMGQSSPKSESQPLVNTLSENAEAFIRHFDSCYKNIQQCLHVCQLWSKRLERLRCYIVGYINGVLSLFIFSIIAAIIAIQLRVALPVQFGLLALPVMIVIYFIRIPYKSGVNEVNSKIREFRKSVFCLIIELGKLKQRCEDLTLSLELGVEKDNLKRLKESIDELLDQMENLTETVTLQTMDEVQKEYVNIFNQLDKMKVRLSFYSDPSNKLHPEQF